MAEEQRSQVTDLHAIAVLSEDQRTAGVQVELNGDAIYLNYRQLRYLPPRLFDPDVHAALRRLYLKHNLIQSLPPEMKLFQHLTELYLHSNELKTLPEEVCELTSLEMLGASENQLTSLPRSIGRLRNLRRLRLSDNQLKQLPPEIGGLEQLQTLEISHNQLRKLPPQLCHCANLRQLCVDSNLLVSLPRQLCQLTQLEEISACDNRLVTLPQDLGRVSSLQTLYMDNNPFLTAIPASILHKTIGFCRSGISPIPESLANLQQQITIGSGQEDEMSVALPPEIRTLGQICTNCVPMLLELTLRMVSKALKASASNIQEGEIPSELTSLLKTPTGHCQNCHAEIFISAFPMVFRAQVQTSNLLLLGLCCSSWCVRQCSLIVNLPLLYPRLEDLALAIVLA